LIVPDKAVAGAPWRRKAVAARVAALVAVALAGAEVATPAQDGRPKVTGYVTAKDLAATCRASEAACVSYTVGVLDAVSVARAAGERPPLFCVPARTTIADLGHTVANWLDAHRDMQSYAAAEMVIRAVTEAHPCKG
jgi:hypothetical protein